MPERTAKHGAKYTIPPKRKLLPNNTKIQKRPILHAPIASPYAGPWQEKVVYMGTRTPFKAAEKRVRALLAEIDRRAMGDVKLVPEDSRSKDKLSGKAREEQNLAILGKKRDKEQEAVYVKGTGKAIEKTLVLAHHFQQQPDCKVVITTGTVTVIDDVIETDIKEAVKNKSSNPESEGLFANYGDGNGDLAMADQGHVGDKVAHEDAGEEDDIPETQLRSTSMVQVAISLR